MNYITLKKYMPFLIIFLVLGTNLFFGLPRLVKYSAVDEHLWTYKRTPDFWNAIAQHKLKNTGINDKPGITVALISGLGILGHHNPKAFNKFYQGEKTKSSSQLNTMEKINFDFRLPIYLFTLLLTPVFFFLLKKLFNQSVALFSIIFIYLSPILLGMSLFVNPDSLFWLFVPLSLFSFLIFQKKQDNKYAVISGIFLGLALLTKYVSSILYPFFILLILADYFFYEQEKNELEYFKKSLIGYGWVILISTLTVTILFPNIWIEPKKLLEVTFFSDPFNKVSPYILAFIAFFAGSIFFWKKNFASLFLPLAKYKDYFFKIILTVFLAGIIFIFADICLDMKLYDFQSILTLAKFKEDASIFSKIIKGGFLSGLYILIFSLTPIVFLSFLYSLLINIRKKTSFSKENFLPTIYLLVFIFTYYIAFSANGVHPTTRYQISIFPLVSVLAALGLHHLLTVPRLKKYYSTLFISLILIIICSMSLLSIKPFYFTYASSLLPKKYTLNVNYMGDGSYEAATYLNRLPNARKLSVWTDQVATCEYFVGRCSTTLQRNITPHEYYDYYAVSKAREARTLYVINKKRYLKGTAFDKIKNAYASNNPDDFNLIIDNRPNNFIKVVKNTDSL